MQKIFNHYSPTLSKLDQEIAKYIPQGGNWKKVPKDVPSRRIEQIRISYAQGGGSRSTYYGRLSENLPSYTINTYFSRPGNGCHLHYDVHQNRVISHREAARLQTFDDNFKFIGSKTSIQTQIGNAVPPLLAYNIAKLIGHQGDYIDLFSGCGGMSYGFKSAGWKPIIANDIISSFLETYRYNIHDCTVLGDIRNKNISSEIIHIARGRSKHTPLWILGGPPCQGFSTAGNKRSLEDARNWLFRDYKNIITSVQPNGFVFENVPGILNMNKGDVFKMITDELAGICQSLHVFILNSEEFGIPQRRRRVIIIGLNDKHAELGQFQKTTQFKNEKSNNIFRAISVKDALGDLPPLIAGQDGSNLDYRCEPLSNFQKMMRRQITVPDYYRSLSDPAASQSSCTCHYPIALQVRPQHC